MEEYSEKIGKSARLDGTAVAVFEMTRPAGEGGSIGKLIDAIITRLSDWFDRELVPAAKREYDLSDDPRKRYRFAPLTLMGEVKKTAETGNNAEYSLTLTLWRSGSAAVKITRKAALDTRSGKTSVRGSYKPSKKRSGR